MESTLNSFAQADKIRKYAMNKYGTEERQIFSPLETLKLSLGMNLSNMTMFEIGSLHIGAIIGKGGFSEVYEAERVFPSNIFPLHFAVKRLISMNAFESDFLQLQKEIIFNIPNHPNIVFHWGLAILKDEVYAYQAGLVMEVIAGGTIKDLLLENDQVRKNLEIRIHLAKQIADGMDFLHKQKDPIIHKDLHWENCLVEQVQSDSNSAIRYIAKINDFGLSFRLNSEPEKKAIMKKIKPPEYPTFTTKSDVYQYGYLLFQLITCSDISSLEDSDIPQSLHLLVKQCLEEKPEKRPSFEVISKILEDILKNDLNTSISLKDFANRTIAHQAAIDGNCSILDLLSNEELSKQDIYMYTPLHLAVFFGKNEIVEKLMKRKVPLMKGGKIEFSPLLLSIVLKDEKNAITIAQGASLQELEMRDIYGRNALMFAVESDMIELVTYLLQRNVNVNSKSNILSTPIFSCKSTNMLSLLLSHGATLSVYTAGGVSPLVPFVASENKELVHYVLSKHRNDADYERNIVAKGLGNGISLMCILASNTTPISLEMMEILLDYGFNSNIRNIEDGKTPIFFAIMAENYKGIDLLKSRGASLDIRDNYGRPPSAFLEAIIPIVPSNTEPFVEEVNHLVNKLKSLSLRELRETISKQFSNNKFYYTLSQNALITIYMSFFGIRHIIKSRLRAVINSSDIETFYGLIDFLEAIETGGLPASCGYYILHIQDATPIFYKYDKKEKSWFWSPGDDIWMSCNIAVVHSGRWKGETPHIDNVITIRYLDLYKPVPRLSFQDSVPSIIQKYCETTASTPGILGALQGNNTFNDEICCHLNNSDPVYWKDITVLAKFSLGRGEWRKFSVEELSQITNLKLLQTFYLLFHNSESLIGLFVQIAIALRIAKLIQDADL